MTGRKSKTIISFKGSRGFFGKRGRLDEDYIVFSCDVRGKFDRVTA